MIEASQWLGTPFEWGQRRIGQGVDCVQLIVAVAGPVGLVDPDDPRFSAYTRRKRPALMREVLERYMVEILTPPERGDVLWLRTTGNNRPLHFALYAGNSRIIHVHTKAGKVVETNIPMELRARVDSVWRFKGLIDG